MVNCALRVLLELDPEQNETASMVSRWFVIIIMFYNF